MQAERKNRFRSNHGRPARRGHHADNSGGGADSRADCGAGAAAGDGPNHGAQASRRANGRHIPALRTAARSLEQLRLKSQLLAVDQGQLGQINSQLRCPAAMPAFLYLRDSARLRLAAARHHPSIHDDWLIEYGAEIIADHVAVGRDPIIRAHSNYGPGRQCQRLREHRLVWLPLRLADRAVPGAARLLRLSGSVRLPLSLRIGGVRGGLDFVRLILLSASGPCACRKVPTLNPALSGLQQSPVSFACRFGDHYFVAPSQSMSASPR